MIPSETPGWRKAFKSRAFLVQMVISLIILLFLAVFAGRFFEFVEAVDGSELKDPILALLPARNMSIAIFSVIYGALIIGIIHLARSPYLFLRAVEAYVVLTLLRMFTLLLFPLEPDRNMVPLIDPFIDNLFYGGRMITKDLFFSGHTALLALLAMVVENVYLKYLFWIATLTVGTLLLVQHAHYAPDVIMAPVFCWISLMIARNLMSATISSPLLK